MQEAKVGSEERGCGGETTGNNKASDGDEWIEVEPEW